MKIMYDKKADAMAVQFLDERISKDEQIAENVFAGYSREGSLVEIQIIDISSSDKPWFTVEAAAKYMDKSEKTILRWIKSGKIKPKKVGNEYRIAVQELKKLAS